MDDLTLDSSPQTWEEIVIPDWPRPPKPPEYLIDYLLIWRSHMLELCRIPSELLEPDSNPASRLVSKGFVDVHHQRR